MFIKNCWYVAAWSSEVEAGKILARTILNTPLAFWRKEDGEAVAFEDRCCHRGAPLSMGRLEKDSVRCMYHGLLFNSCGKCIEIPGQERIPPQAKVSTYKVVEKHSWIWIWLGDAELADPNKIPDTHWLDDPAWRSLEGYKHYKTNYLLIADNLLDFAHLPFVHPTTLGGDEAYAACIPEIVKMDNGVKVIKWGEGILPPPFVQSIKNYPGKVDRWNIYDFVLPGILIMDSGSQPEGTGAKEGVREDAVEFHSCQALTPETEHSTHYFYAQPRNFNLEDDELSVTIHRFVEIAFEEDWDMIHAQANVLSLDPDFKMVGIASDMGLSYFRWLVSKELKKEAANLIEVVSQDGKN